ncbi:MAG: DivIVA domain-containing protein, partial [Nakamurella sp.]
MAARETSSVGTIGMTAADIRALRFSQTKGFGRGYDTAEVDRIISQCAA